MAILRLGAIITQISGKVGGQSFVNGSQGTYLKNIGNQTKQPTPAQQKQRSATGFLMQFWRTLSESEYKTWRDQVGNWSFKNRVGNIHFYTAFQIFMLLNQGRLLIGETINKTAHNPDTIYPAPIYFSNTATSQLEFNFISKDSKLTYVLWMSPPVGKGKRNVNNLMRVVQVFNYDEGRLEYDVTEKYLEVFGYIPINATIGFTMQTVISASGQRDSRPKADFIVTT